MVVAKGLSCSVACGIFLDQGSNLSRKVLSLLSLPTVSLSLTHTDGLIYHILHTAYNLLSSDYLMMLFPSSLPRQADHRLL